VVFRTALADEDIAGFGRLAAEEFDAETLTFTVAAVIGTTYAFFMCHGSKRCVF
jgi:hypothetical protein